MLRTFFPGGASQRDWEDFLGVPPGYCKGQYGRKKAMANAIDGFRLAPEEPPAGPEVVKVEPTPGSAGSFTFRK